MKCSCQINFCHTCFNLNFVILSISSLFLTIAYELNAKKLLACDENLLEEIYKHLLELTRMASIHSQSP